MLAEHLTEHRQMAFVSGPWQVGKTTTCRLRADAYLNWDDFDDREAILAGPKRVAAIIGLDRLRAGTPLVLFDELHKFPRWKQFLKGFFDAYAGRVRIAVTGSSRLGIYRRGGDSLMGRYFSYRMHPFSVAEIAAPDLPDPVRIVRAPREIADADWDALGRHGGYPEPWLKRDRRFDRRWRSLRFEQLVREDIRDLAEVRQLDQLALLARMLGERSAEQLVFSNLASLVRVSVDTARRWVATLCDFHLGFLVRPWFRNVTRSLRKEPKWFLRDWASIADAGRRAETFVACHLLKAVEGWTDLGARGVRTRLPAGQGEAGSGLRGGPRRRAVVPDRGEAWRCPAESRPPALSGAAWRAVRLSGHAWWGLRRGGRLRPSRSSAHRPGPDAAVATALS